jgi:hypothetical protein
VIVLLDTSEALDVCAQELGVERGSVKQLLCPTTGRLRQKNHDEFAMDNGAYAGFNVASFLSMLARENEAKHLCRFVAVPDVVADARRTLEVFEHWKYALTGWPLALVAQDGLENLPIPWKHLAAVFIGGTTAWKLGNHARTVIRAAQAVGVYVHVGRVNTPGRFEYFDELGVDSIDGTGLARYSHMREAIWRAYHQPTLLTSQIDHAQCAGESSPQETKSLCIAVTASAITVVNRSDEGESESMGQ